MNQSLNWDQIRHAFPDEWVAIDHVVKKSHAPYGEIVGEVIAHHRDEAEFTRQLKQRCVSKSTVIDIRYTGEVLPDNPVGPLLWRISHTPS